MTNEVDNVLKEVANQTKKFGGLRNLDNYNYEFGDPSSGTRFTYLGIMDFVERHDLPQEKLAEKFIQEMNEYAKVRFKEIFEDE